MAAFSTKHGGAVFRFASRANLRAFVRSPERYAPRFGGFCAYGVSVGKKFDGDPNYAAVVDGKLYLNNSLKVQERFEQDVPGHINNATLNWEIIKDKKPEDLKEPIIRN